MRKLANNSRQSGAAKDQSNAGNRVKCRFERDFCSKHNESREPMEDEPDLHAYRHEHLFMQRRQASHLPRSSVLNLAGPMNGVCWGTFLSSILVAQHDGRRWDWPCVKGAVE